MNKSTCLSDATRSRRTGFGLRRAIIAAWSLALVMFASGFTGAYVADVADGSSSTTFAAESDPTRTDDQIVERWRGTVHQEFTTIDGGGGCPAPWGCWGDSHRLQRHQWDLEVYADGYVRGHIRSTLLAYSYREKIRWGPDISCGAVAGGIAETDYIPEMRSCTYAPQIIQPNGLVFVEGKRENDQFTGQPILRLENWSMIEECKVNWTARGITRRTGAVIYQDRDRICNWFGVPQRYPIQTFEDGRAPRIRMGQGYLIGLVEEPFLELDRELLERSVFLEQIPVEELFTANMNWNSPGGGWVTWQWADEAPERIGPTTDAQISKPIDQGTHGIGERELQVQGKGSLGQNSRPETMTIPIAPRPEWTGDPAQISADKVQGAVVYKASLKFPEPAFEANVTVPAAIPWFGGNPMGIAKTQGTLEWEAHSTSEGQGKLSGESEFTAMGGAVLGSVIGRAKVVLNPSGVQIPEGGMEFQIAGKLAGKEQSLLQVVPALNPALVALQRISPRAAGFVTERAKAKLELQPQLAIGFNYLTQDNRITFPNAEAKSAIGFKTIVEIKLIKDVLSASAAIGGEIAATFQVPAPYFKEAALKGLVEAKITLYRYAWEAERSWSVVLGGSAAAAGDHRVDEQVWESHHGSGGWRLLDTAYLDDPNYARWAGDDPAIQAGFETGQDKLLVENIFPQANPSMHVWSTPSGHTRVAQAWAHDTPLGGVIRYSRNQGSPLALAGHEEGEHGEHDDLAPKIVYLPNDGTMVLWQRMNVPMDAAPDFNDDPAGYLGSWQIAAQRTGTNQPLYALSNGSSLNYRHYLGATPNGALAVWVNNPANQIMGDATNPDHILFAQYQTALGFPGGHWSEAAPVLSDVAGLLDLDLATAAHSGMPASEPSAHLAALVYSLDMEGGSELFYVTWDGEAWSAPTQLTHNNVSDEQPQLVLDANGAPSLVWRQAGTLKFLHGSWDATPVDLDFPEAAERLDYTLVQGADGKLALVWQAVDAAETRIAYAIYDAEHGLWSAPRTVPPPALDDADDLVTSTAPTLATNIAAGLLPPRQLLLTYQLAHVELVTRTVNTDEGAVAIPNLPQIGQHDLRLATVPLSVNLSVGVDDLSTPAADQLQAVIRNTGDLAAGSVPVVLYIGVPDPESGLHTHAMTQTLPLLAAGSAATLTFSLAPSAVHAALFTVHIDPGQTLDESNPADNKAVLGADLQMTLLPAYYSPEGIIVRGQVNQQGPLYTSLTVNSIVSLDGPNSPVLGGSQIGFPLTPTVDLMVSALITPGVLGPGRHLLVWTLDPEGVLGQGRQDGAQEATTVMVLPDLAADPDLVYFDRAPGDAAAFRMEVHNLGNWPNDGGFVEVFDGMPGRTGVHSLLRVPLPPIEPGEAVELSGLLQLASLPAAQTGLSAIYIQLDPDGEIDEISKNNNLIAAGDALENADTVQVEHWLHIPAVQR